MLSLCKGWTSRECGLTAPSSGTDKIEMARAVEDLSQALQQHRKTQESSVDDYFQGLTSAWEQYTKEQQVYPTELLTINKKKPKAASGQEEWSVEQLEASLTAKRNELYAAKDLDVEREPFSLGGGSPNDTKVSIQWLTPTDDNMKFEQSEDTTLSIQAWQLQTQPVSSRADCWPLPMPLRVRQSRRCRAELAEGRPGILLKPKLNPLEGDSSLRTGHGQWWRKVGYLFLYVCINL